MCILNTSVSTDTQYWYLNIYTPGENSSLLQSQSNSTRAAAVVVSVAGQGGPSLLSLAAAARVKVKAPFQLESAAALSH